MASTMDQPLQVVERGNADYPTSDRRPMAESDLHRNMMLDAIEALKAYYAGQTVYVTGNLLVFLNRAISGGTFRPIAWW